MTNAMCAGEQDEIILRVVLAPIYHHPKQNTVMKVNLINRLWNFGKKPIMEWRNSHVYQIITGDIVKVDKQPYITLGKTCKA